MKLIDKVKSVASDSDYKVESLHKSQGSGSTRRIENDDPVSNLKTTNQIKEMFKYFFLDRHTSRYKDLFTRHEFQILKESLRSTYKMKCLLEVEQQAFLVDERADDKLTNKSSFRQF